MGKKTSKETRAARIAIFMDAREAAARREHELAGRLFASIGISYVHQMGN